MVPTIVAVVICAAAAKERATRIASTANIVNPRFWQTALVEAKTPLNCFISYISPLDKACRFGDHFERRLSLIYCREFPTGISSKKGCLINLSRSPVSELSNRSDHEFL